MSARISAALVALALAIPMIVATPAPLAPRTDACNNAPLQCCNSVQSSNSAAAQQALSSLNILLPVVIPVGLTCVPVVGKNDCNQQTVCCNGNNFNGVIVLGCSPINVGVV